MKVALAWQHGKKGQEVVALVKKALRRDVQVSAPFSFSSAMHSNPTIVQTKGGDLTDKAYLITGGSTGIGLATAELLVRDGARVFITGPPRVARCRARAARGQGNRCAIGWLRPHSVPGITGGHTRIRRTTRWYFHQCRRGLFGSFETTTPGMFDVMFDTNMRDGYFTVQALLPLLGEGSTIVFNSSIASRLGQANTSAYSASKAALTSLGRTFAVELAPRGIRVNTLSPGPIMTPAIAKIGMQEEQQKQLVDRTLLKRWGRAEEVARVARFLLTDDSSFIVGEEIAIDGGRQLT